MKRTITTQLAIGGTINHVFGDNGESIAMHNNIPFKKSYESLELFMKEFKPTKPSDNLLKRISEEHEKCGKITFKPIGYKANQTFYFEKQ